MQKNAFLVYQESGGVACQMSWARHLTCMVDFKDEDTACVFYVIKPIRHFLTSAAHSVAPCLCWMSLFVLISITEDWLLALAHHRERGRPGREAFLRQCRSSTDFLWCWRMPVTADLPWDQRKSQREREMVNQWCTNPAQLLSFLTQWPLQRFGRGSYLCFWWNVSSGKRLIALDYQLTIASCILLCWIFSLTTQLEKRNIENENPWKIASECL